MIRRKELREHSERRGNTTAAFILVVLIAFVGVFITSANCGAAEKYAVIAIDPSLNAEYYLNSTRIKDEINWYRDNGYKLASVPGTVDDIMQELLTGKVKAITFVGHGGANVNFKPVSGLANLDARGWQRKMRFDLAERYRNQGVAFEEAERRATAESQNFNLDRVVNYSCHSLVDTRIAELFVKPGGVYWGSSLNYTGNPLAFLSMLFGDGQFLLEEYRPAAKALSCRERCDQMSDLARQRCYVGCEMKTRECPCRDCSRAIMINTITKEWRCFDDEQELIQKIE